MAPKKKKDIRQRKKGGDISRTVELIVPSYPPDVDEKVKLEIRASEEDWKKLRYFDPSAKSVMEHLGKLFWKDAIRPSIDFMESKKPRGKYAINHEEKKEIIEKSRSYVAVVLVIASAWAKKPEKEWSEDFKRTIDRLSESKKSIYHNRWKEHIVPMKIAYLLWQEKFQAQYVDLGLKEPKNIGSFRKMFRDKNYYVHAKKVIERYIENNKKIPEIDIIYANIPSVRIQM